MNYFIETDRLVLRPITVKDAEDFFEMDSNSNVHLYLGNNPVTSIEQSIAMIKDIMEQYKTFGIGRLAITKKDTDQFIGWSGLKYECTVRKEFNYYDIGYRLKEQFWGHGYATEAAQASLDFGFKKLKLNEICAAAEVNHKASNHILQKIGMHFSDTFKYEDKDCNWYIKKNTCK